MEPMKLNYFKSNNKCVNYVWCQVSVTVLINSYSETMQIYLLYFFICEHLLLYESVFLCSTSRFSLCNENTLFYKGYLYV